MTHTDTDRPRPARIITIHGKKDELLSLADVGQVLGCSPRTVRRIMDDPVTPLVGIHVIPGATSILRSNLTTYLEWQVDRALGDAVGIPATAAPQAEYTEIPAPKRRKKR